MRLTCLAFACFWRVLQAARIAARPSVVTLCYHGVRRDQRRSFEMQMGVIAHRAAAAGSACARPIRSRLPRVSVTFDDGFASLMEHALPVLHQVRIHAMIFIVTGQLGSRPRWSLPDGHPDARERLLTEEELRSLAQRDALSIGSHTATHPKLTSLDDDSLRKELVRSRISLEALLDHSIVDLALPFGAADERVIRAAREAGYERVYTVDPARSRADGGIAIVGRWSMSPDVWPLEFRLTVDGAYAWLPLLRCMIRAAGLFERSARIRGSLRSLLSRSRHRRDARIDRKWGINTTAVPLDRVTRDDRNQDSVHYEPLHYDILSRVLKDLRISPVDVVYDIGSGLGRMLFACANAGAKRCVGIELSAELAAIARRNAQTFCGGATVIETRNEDAARADYSDGTIYILHNPFGERTLRVVMERIRRSILDRPRNVRIVYIVPRQEHVLAECNWLTLRARWKPRLSRVEATYWSVTP